jgi:predicted phage terminase large subunit-like protein
MIDPRVYDTLSDRQLEEWAPAFDPKWTAYIPHRPHAQQRAFLLLTCQEAMYGGAAGGGKSDALLMAALQYVDCPGYAALLLRRSYADLEKPGALIPRSHDWLDPTDAHWNGFSKKWTFPSGAVIDFGYLDNDKDKENYRSAEYQFIGFDELTQFMEPWYRYLFSRKRRLKMQSNIPTRVRSATNPGGIGHEWVRQRFIIEGPDHGRVFIPAKLEDNPSLDQQEYEASLKELDPITYAQLRHGDWSVRPPGVFFKRHWFEILDEEPAGLRWIRSWDLAATKTQTSAFTAGARVALRDGVLYIANISRSRGDPGETERLVKQTAELDGKGVHIWIEQEPGSGGVNTLFRYQRSVLLGYAVSPFLPKHDKLTRASPLSSMARAGNVKLIRGPWINAFLDEADGFPEGFKDQVDACSAAQTILTQAPQPMVRRL